jgi:hypothetical protein
LKAPQVQNGKAATVFKVTPNGSFLRVSLPRWPAPQKLIQAL